MKKIISCILVSVLLLSANVSAEMQLRLSADSNELVGTEQGLEVNDAIKVIILKDGVDIRDIDFDDPIDVQSKILYFDVFTPDEKTASIDVKIDLSSFENNAVYRVFAIPALTSKADNAEESADKYVEIGYAKLEDREQYAADIKSALALGAAALKEKLEAEGKYLGVDYEMMKLSDLGKVALVMLEEKAGLDSGAVNAERISAFIDDAVLVDVLNGTNSGKVTAEYLEELILNDSRYADIKDIFSGIPSQSRENILSDISGKNFKNYSGLKQQIKNSTVINAFNYTNTNADNLYKILCDFASVVEPEINIGKLSALVASARNTAITNLVNKKYKTVAELKKAIDGRTAKDTVINAPSGGGGGGGSSGAGSISFTPPAGAGLGLAPFNDMAAYKWAEDALYYLVQKNIVSGYGDNTFKPENNITRAEFIKIVVSCFFNGDIDDIIDMPFTDVDAEKWYSKYIAAALKNKIVSGLSDAEFGPERYITRQDMAVVLYNAARIIDFEMVTGEIDIEDEADISEYALDAVRALKIAGVINGYEDGSFKPKNSANRAETVQMVYNFLIKKGELENE